MFDVSGDELFSDTYPMKLVDDCLYEVYGKVGVVLLRVEKLSIAELKSEPVPQLITVCCDP